MNRAFVSFGVGEFADLLDIAKPGFQEYADRHGYTLLTRPPRLALRPPSWHKVTVLLDALERYDEALWVDCDVVICDPSQDLADEVPDRAWQAITRHHTPEGEVPSVGVWYVRQPMQSVLEQVWRLTRYQHHRWWEQAAVQDLLGYTPEQLPVHQEKETELSRCTHWLDQEWNQLVFTAQPEPSPRFAHVQPGHPPEARARLMRELAGTAALKGA